MSLESRVMELESRLAFQDDTIQALNDVLVGQQRVIDRLQQQLMLVAKRQEEMSHRMDGFEDDVPPPHY
ncbi:SlyX family protein [Pseudomonas sp. DTU_2021_1001937_2_SI_NGA_ILE_001]|uniref:SlyX family protein n=1 Tax=Pseudomonas sp. DTU_2021_1001937_2_SI_NGA_ILE_001 TaxID=3077589 RepID=UPI0025EEBEF9|nr:SlyX family protein [Pseudomonas sp. DTU_2021_1001937_2_SI_NGA_ILE_001]WNW11294.1 SlyX family protein [Pseudomonas sp. DTU_2021_1001937_2_SI_NGA_ILE_001]